MTIVGSKRMIVYDDVAPLEKIRIFDARVERPPHYDTFAEFHYAYHYGDMYAPYIKQEEPLKTECQHFLDCIRDSRTPLTNGERGLELIRILEASSHSLKQGGGPVELSAQQPAAAAIHATALGMAPVAVSGNGHSAANGNGHVDGNGNGNGNGHEISGTNGNVIKPVRKRSRVAKPAINLA